MDAKKLSSIRTANHWHKIRVIKNKLLNNNCRNIYIYIYPCVCNWVQTDLIKTTNLEVLTMSWLMVKLAWWRSWPWAGSWSMYHDEGGLLMEVLTMSWLMVKVSWCLCVSVSLSTLLQPDLVQWWSGQHQSMWKPIIYTTVCVNLCNTSN